MRVIIGILLGLAIIFNWTDIRNYMDAKISSSNNTSQNESNDEDRKSDEELDDNSSDIESNSNDSKNSKDDGWSDFR